MKRKKCPYCGKRVSYVSSFASRRKGEFVCQRCGKESKVIISKAVFLVFSLAAVISLAVMAAWIYTEHLNNPWGILLVAVPLIIFSLITPKFVNYEPLKKYKKSMEARKAGIEYSDNLVTSELDSKDLYSFPSASLDNSGKFQINSDVFNKIKAERTAAREELGKDDILSDSGAVKVESENKSYVPIINDVSENHGYADAPLKKIHSENLSSVSRTRHYIPEPEDLEESERKKPDGNRYSANRKF